MTIHAPSQFTPAQVLDAARRAEAEGRLDLAGQFYRHLMDYYPGLPEAAAAHDAVMRLEQPAPPLGGSNGTGQYQHDQGELRHLEANASPYGSGNGMPAGATNWPAHDRGRRRPNQQATAPAERRGNRLESPGLELPSRSHDFRSGRGIARLLAWSGAVVMLAGAGMVPISIAGPKFLAMIPAIGSYVTSPLAALAMLVLGAAMVLLGQVARAVLEMANAGRDLASLGRARAQRAQASDSGTQGRQRRD